MLKKKRIMGKVLYIFLTKVLSLKKPICLDPWTLIQNTELNTRIKYSKKKNHPPKSKLGNYLTHNFIHIF